MASDYFSGKYRNILKDEKNHETHNYKVTAHFKSTFYFYSPRKHKKLGGFLIFPGSIEMGHKLGIGW